MRRWLWFLLLVHLLTSSCRAAEPLEAQVEMLQPELVAEALPESASEIMDGATPTNPGAFSTVLERIAGAAAQAWRRWMPDSLRTAGLAIAVVLLCSLIQGIGGGETPVLTAAGSLALVGICTSGLRSVFAIGTETLEQMEAFSTVLLSALSTTVASTGAVTSAATLYAGSMFFLHFLTRLITSLLLPLVYGYVAAGTAAAALGNETLRRVGDLLKWAVTLCLKTIATAFIAYLSISGVVTGSADTTAVKAVKLAVSTAVPVVGSIISDASETVLVSAGLLKNAVGVFGLLGVLSICVVPFTRIGLQYLSLKLAAALSGVVDATGMVKLLDMLSTAMGLILAMTAVALLLTVFSCVCALRLMSP